MAGLSWASPTDGEITSAYAGTSKKEWKKEKVSLADTKTELKIPAILKHRLRPQTWITSEFYFPVIKHSSLQQEHQADIWNSPFDWNYTKSECCKVTASLHMADSNY